MAKKSKPAPAKKKTSLKSVKPSHKKSTPPSHPEPKAAAKPTPSPAPKPAKPEGAVKKSNARDLLRSRILGRQKASKPIAFSLDEVREIAKTVVDKTAESAEAKPAKTAKAGALSKVEIAKPTKPNHVKAASLADILGFSPGKTKRPATELDEEEIPEKFRRYYRLLLELRNHVTGQLDAHTEETLKRSSKDDAGDLSAYGQHMADAGTDTFDRDFALSLVSSEQEALSEIEAAIQRIKNGTYGICEVTQKPIAKERLLAVPFTRYSAEAQKEIERNRHRTRTQAGLFGELGEDGAKIEESGDDE
ncbi:MAG TPA: TraR/DksA C4-type zinc finger protein [Opitutaceae bacterium]